jgi:hypothetical protein
VSDDSEVVCRSDVGFLGNTVEAFLEVYRLVMETEAPVEGTSEQVRPERKCPVVGMLQKGQ